MQDEFSLGLSLIPALASSNRPPASRPVIDAYEEIFLLYTLSAAEVDRRGLGQVDNKNDLLQVTVYLHDTSKVAEVVSIDHEGGECKSTSSRAKVGQKRTSASLTQSRSQAVKTSNADTLQVNIRQDSTSLRSTGGDTGSVVWRASVGFASKVMQDLSEAERGRKRHASEPVNNIFSPQDLKNCLVLELGSGTGILAALLLSHPYINRPGNQLQWLATDQANMLQLLSRNLSCFPRAHVEALDWVDASTIYRLQSPSSINDFLQDMFAPLNHHNREGNLYPDLIVATDCIFNPHLFEPFVDTLNLCSTPQKTIVVVVCELREAEAMTEFLQTWMAGGRKGEQWSIHTLEGEQVVGKGLVKGSVVWVAWRTC